MTSVKTRRGLERCRYKNVTVEELIDEDKMLSNVVFVELSAEIRLAEGNHSVEELNSHGCVDIGFGSRE